MFSISSASLINSEIKYYDEWVLANWTAWREDNTTRDIAGLKANWKKPFFREQKEWGDMENPQLYRNSTYCQNEFVEVSLDDCHEVTLDYVHLPKTCMDIENHTVNAKGVYDYDMTVD
jgi:hypothetical protein